MPTMATYKGALSSRVGLLCLLSRSFSYSLYGHIIDVFSSGVNNPTTHRD